MNPAALLLLAAAATPVTASTEVDGVRVELTATPAGADQLTIDVRLSDVDSGDALTEAQPLGWLVPEAEGQPCRTVLARALNGSLASKAVSLNSVLIGTSFADGGFALIDPQTKFAGTQDKAAIDLQMDVAQAVSSGTGGTILLKARDGNLALVSTGPSPGIVSRGQAAPDAAIAGEGSDFWVFDTAGLRRYGVDRTPLPWPTEGRPFVNASIDGGVLLGSAKGRVGLHAGGAAGISAVESLSGIVAAAYMPRAASWLASDGHGDLWFIASGRPVTSVTEVSDVVAVAAEPEGRYAIALADGGATAVLVDASQGKAVFRAALGDRYDRITTSGDFAYLHSANSPLVQLASFTVMRQMHKISLVEVPFGEAGATGGAAYGRVAVIPGGAAVVGSDGRTIYVYGEGMMVPMGSLAGVTRTVTGLTTIDHSLRPVEPGHYQTVVRLNHGGQFQVPVRLAAPRLDACLTLAIAGEGGTTDLATQRSAFVDLPAQAALGQRVVLMLHDGDRRPAMIARVSDGIGRWQQHVALARQPGGQFAGEIRFFRPGHYHLFAGDAHGEVTVAEGSIAQEAKP